MVFPLLRRTLLEVRRNAATGVLKTFIRSVGLLLFVLAAGMATLCLFNVFSGRIGVVALLGIIAFFSWRMFRKWDRLTVQLYSLVQTILTAITLGEIAKFYWQDYRVAGGFVIIFMGRYLELFLLRYFGFSSGLPNVTKNGNPPDEVTGTPWLSDPDHTTQ
jgi:hypothetical protein